MKKGTVLKLPISKSNELWSVAIPYIGLLVYQPTIKLLIACVQESLEQAVSHAAFRAEVERRTTDGKKFLFISVTRPELLRRHRQARKQFKPRSLTIKPGPKDELSISLDYDMNPLKPYVSLLLIPNVSDHEHSHICLSVDEARKLKAWLNKWV